MSDPTADTGEKEKSKSQLKKEAKRLAQEERKKAKQPTNQTANTNNAPTKKKEKKPQAEPETVPVDQTPKGQKKIFTEQMPNAYYPGYVESAWYDWWEQCGFFKPRLQPDGRPLEKGVFVIPIPPPNVTGSLHLGHALTNSIQDALIRYHRMQGFSTVYVPGCDHAGISTQAVVEKKIWKQSKTTRHELGRENFIQRVWQWKNEYGDKIYHQLRCLGSSYDWSRVCFTMDDKFVKAVTETFVRLHEEGIIYRDTRLVNWCCQLNTTLSNLEVDTKELEGRTFLHVPGHDPNKKYEFGVLITFAYPIQDSDEKIIVATTRLETMLGDTAVAVHPNDDRYKHLIGKRLVHPFFPERDLRVIADDMVDREFGTGCVKITPAHDPNDYQVGKRHQLPFINILNDDGTINENGGKYQGMKRFDVRVEILKELKQLGLYVETKPNKMSIPICSRTGDIIEPLLKPQWYVNCQEMAQEAIRAVKEGELTIFPRSSEKEWFSWLENIQDWCISRQLWWGHSIPAYFVNVKGESNERHDGNYWVSGRTKEEALEKAKQKFPNKEIELEQDEDVLDTWFSSALWPFAIFGWPEKTPDFVNFYPNSVLETGWDILFFWVARMVFFGMKLTGKVPFKHVFCHAMVRDAHGRKMSKSLGNVIDPLDVMTGATLEKLHAMLEQGNLDPREIEKAKEGQKKDFPKGIPECGTDAMRFSLCAYQGTNRDINLDISRVEGYRKFCNKLWNATKFALMKLGTDYQPKPNPPQLKDLKHLPEKWILHHLNRTIKEVHLGFQEYNFFKICNDLYVFWLNELCDVYIEAIKPIVDGDNEEEKVSVRDTLYCCLDYGLKLLHPFMPFVTEELWQRLPRRPNDSTDSIMISEFPQEHKEWDIPEADLEFDRIQQIAKVVRSLSSEYNITKNAQIYCQVLSDDFYQFLKKEEETLKTLCFIKNMHLEILSAKQLVPEGCAFSNVNEECNVYLLVRGQVDLDAEIQKLEQQLKKTELLKEQLIQKTTIPGYEQKVKLEIREQNDLKIKGYETEAEALKRSIGNFLKLK